MMTLLEQPLYDYVLRHGFKATAYELGTTVMMLRAALRDKRDIRLLIRVVEHKEVVVNAIELKPLFRFADDPFTT